MEQIEEIRRLDGSGVPRSEIAARLGVSRPTVRKWADRAEFVVPCPVPAQSRPSILDEFKPVIDEILADDKVTWGKQHHTAKRIWERLRDEHHYPGQYSVVQRYVKAKRAQARVEAESGGFNLLEWPPGTVQVDFGEADFAEPAGLVRLPYLTCSFPFSNQGFVQVFRGETAECVCQGLQDIFDVIGGVPTLAVFDNAAGVGRRLGDVIREAEVFRLFRLHYRFGARWCNPYSGHEKGHVENKVGTVRRNLFVPIPKIGDLEEFNHTLLAGVFDTKVVHYRKGIPIVDLFAEDQGHLLALPARRFDVVRWATYTTDKYGIVTVDGVHQYSVSPQMPQTKVVVGFRAHQVEVHSQAGDLVACHRRLFGGKRGQSLDQVAMMTALIPKPGAWGQSGLRATLGDGPGREFLDGQDRRALQSWLAGIREHAIINGLDQVRQALDWLAGQDRPFTVADLGAVAARAAGYGLDRSPDDGPDLGIFDAVFIEGTAAA